MARVAGKTTITLFRPPAEGEPRVVLDSIGPVEQQPAVVLAMLDSFDIWALNAPDAPGAACMTIEGARACKRTLHDYSLVMKVQSGDEVRVQRYIALEKDTSAARALGDFLLEWAARRERGEQDPPSD